MIATARETDLLTVDELAQRLRVKASWVRDHARGSRRPKIPGIKLGGEWRFCWHTIQQWLKELENGAAA
ncbi:MAG: helix-turn-helix domain-containing protein [Acidobacteriaceae bacterium]|nr:helix-turn-helix domain-containing protein [Acidobacteriaceae bacterium]